MTTQTTSKTFTIDSLVKEGSYYKVTKIDTDFFNLELHDGIHLVVDHHGLKESEVYSWVKEHEAIWLKHAISSVI